MKIGITGATGQLGELTVKRLKEMVKVDSLVALVRSVEKAGGLGIEAREANYGKPETLESSIKGIDTLLLISANEVGKRAAQHMNVIDAAIKAGVKWIVYTSLLHADNSILDLAVEHKATEDAIKASGIPYTILRNGWYHENYTGSVGAAVSSGSFIGSAGNGRISAAARADYAEAAAIVLTSDGQQGKIYELAGDESYTLSDLAAEISRQSSKDIPYRDLPQEEYASALKSFGLPDGLANSIAGWDVAASRGALYDDSGQLSKLIGRPTTPLEIAVAEALK